MRRLPLALLLLVLAPLEVSASGLGLRWDSCYGDGGAVNRNFACDTDAGDQRLVASFRLDAPVTQVGMLFGSIGIASAGTELPAWWRFQLGSACDGCGVGVCLVFHELRFLSHSSAVLHILNGPFEGGDSHYATWQGAIGAHSTLGVGCPAATRASRSTWSGVKAFYR